ncbi:hypothetical protein LCGC14_1324280 [marine sediment metagenome]|uniref:YqgF/RNase H-like domain-containing protein n=1 Tax=marine sediment metagenome TaxID=412755 RepID=A0A0F9MZF2_9ZZZZ
MTYLIAIDPGDKHTGVVELNEDGTRIQSYTYDPALTVKMLEDNLNFGASEHNEPLARMVVEKFQLYPNRTKFKAWSGLEVVELIGVIKYICKKAEIPCLMVAPPDVNAFWRNREIDPTIKKRLHTKHEVSAYRLGEYARVLRPLQPS